MRFYLVFIFSMLLALTACQSGGASISQSQANTDPALTYLPLLTVTAVEKTANGYDAQLTADDGTTFRATVSKTRLGETYSTVKKGDTVKIVGDYTDSEPVDIQATQIIRVR